MSLDELLAVFRYLAAPFEETTGNAINPSDSPEAVLQNITDFCLAHVELLESSKPLLVGDGKDTSGYSSWKLTCVILSLLSKLKVAIEKAEDEQSEEEKTIDVLSIQSQMVVQKSVELVVGFGIVPYLLPGVGVPENIRKMNPNVAYFLSDVKAASPYDHFLRLSYTLETLLICSSHASLGALIIPLYTSDILAGLLQICKSPIAQPKTDINACKPGALSMEQFDHIMMIRGKLGRLMENTFFVIVPKSTLITSLFLIGATKKPRWVSNSCNELLCDLLLSKNGLVTVCTTILDSAGRSDVWKLTRVISSLMKDALIKSGNPKCHQRLSSLTDQCFLMIKQDYEVINKHSGIESGKTDKDISSLFKLPYGTNMELIRIGLFCGLTVMDIDFEFGKSVFWDRLFDCTLKLDQRQKVRQPEMLSVNIQTIAMDAIYGELLLNLLRPINASLPLKLLQPVWSLFLQIFVACERYLKKPVQEPNVAASAEQLHHKLRDVLILLFEIYGSGSGQTLTVAGSSLSNTSTASANPCDSSSSKLVQPKENVDLCDFCMMLILNQESRGIPLLNTFDLQYNDDDESESKANVQVVFVRQEPISSNSNYSEVFENYLDASCLSLSSEILKNERLKGIWPQLFRQLLAWGTKRHAISVQQKTFTSDAMPTRLIGDAITVCLSDCQRFITFKLLGELGDEELILEQFGQSEGVEETLSFLELLLNKFTEEACSSLDETFDTSQLVMYALGIIGALVEAASAASASKQSSKNQSSSGSLSHSYPSSTAIDKELSEMWDHLEIFIPHLRKLSQCTQSSLVRQGVPVMASSLLLSIGTRGVDGQAGRSKSKLLKTRFQQAVEDSMNPMVHVKGHGILELRRLVEEKDSETLENEAQILQLFHHNLSNEDSYVYLMSIQGMAAVGLKFHKTVVPLLIKEYDFVSCDEGGDDESEKSDCLGSKMYQKLEMEERIETRMKVGEILVKVIQKLGGFAPSYRVPLTNVFFRLVRDEEPLIRASALSNLGELCHLLKFTLGIVLTEVWFCVESILNTEKDVHVRRAALHLLVLLLKGVAKDLTAEDILSDNVISTYLRDVRRFLTRTEQIEHDLVAKTHCQLALQELELIVKKLLMPSSQLNFKIKVLDIT